MRDLKQDFENNERLSSRDLYGKRQGRKLKPRQQRLVDELLPTVAVPLNMEQKVDPASWFGDRGHLPTWLEIGFGGGEHLYTLSNQSPQKNLVGVEYYVNGVAKLLSQMDEQPRQNIRIHHGDGRDLLDGIADSSIDRLFVLQPDPWPKKRHQDRRIIRRDNLEAFARVLKPGGVFRISTDHQGYLPWILREMLAARDLFDWTADHADDWRERREDWPDSRYAAKAREQGRQVTYLEYLNRP